MNRFLIIIVALLSAVAAGAWMESRWSLIGIQKDASDESGRQEREILYWVAPMDPNYRREGPGKSPMGMDLVPVYADQMDASGGVTIAPEVIQSMGVRTQAVERGSLWRRIEATGHVGLDESRMRHIHVRTSGWIESLNVSAEGDPVSDGDPLFSLYSPELVNAQKEYLQAQRRSAGPLVAGAEEKLLSLGMLPEQIRELARRGTPSDQLPILAGQDGIVAELNVRENMFITPASVVMATADLSRVWVNARIFENQSEWVDVGQTAEVRLNYLPGRIFRGEVDYVYPVLDPKTRTLRVRLVFENPDGALRPNMFGKVVIYGGPRRDVLSVPHQALIRSGDFDRVVVSLGDGRFEVREVLAGMESGEWVEIVQGLRSGERVVTSAQFMIDSEASLTGSITRLTARESEPVYGAGRVNRVDRAARTINLSHEPIEALSWPAMTMDLPVAVEVDLDTVTEGASIHFSLLADGAGGYRIGMIHLMDGAGHD